MSKNVLITGGAGFIGSNLAYELKRRFPTYNITIFDNFNNRQRRENGNFNFFGDFKNLIGLDVNIIVGNLSDTSDLIELLKNKYDFIFHQGAVSDTTCLDQEEVLRTNALSFKYFIEYCQKNGSKLIYASSAAIYGNTSSPNIVGLGEIPENVYGFSKLQMDMMARNAINLNSGIHIVGLRYFNVYGPGEIYKRRTSSMILQLAKRAIENNTVRLFKHGEQSRDFVYIKDVIEANILALNGRSGIYNIGFGVSRTFNDVVNILEHELQKKINVEYFDNPYSFYQNNTCANLDDSKAGLGYTPKYTLEKGIEEYLPIIKGYTLGTWNYYNE